MFGWPDWKLDPASNSSKCIEQVKRVASRLGAPNSRSSIKFAPYFFYTWAMPANAQTNEDKHFRHSVVQWLVRDASYAQVEPTAAHVASFTADFAQCVAAAVSLGFANIYLNPMIDADYKQPDCCPWRNAAEFDPTVNLIGSTTKLPWSYESLVLRPTLAAAKAAVGSNRNITISFGLGAELGRTFTVFGAQWAGVTKRVQAALAAIVDSYAVGPQFDPTKLCGNYCDAYSPATRVTTAQWAAFRAFLQVADMLGTSNYPNVWERYNASTKALDAPQSLRNFASQLQQFGGVSLASLRAAGKGFISNEIGLGGCRDFGCDGTTTPDIIELSKNAFNGQGSYEDYSSPPKLVDPFRYLWTKAFRMEWWRQQLAFMRDSSHELAVDAVYLWPVGSWDVAAIYHPDSKGQSPDAVGCDPKASFCDPELLAMMRNFNRAGLVPARPFFNLPGPAYYTPPNFRRRRQAGPCLPAQLPDNVPDWALPLVLSRPQWGCDEL
ncbi:hypothetical protein OEZ85_000443 [Tetradesmus obliquus]|uniref:GH18 domain-containing protein n=1 Tax=Tetradesmus obliquus TaxID=3088 RepID=A0ABY8UIS7_TETOB|nr:hypothetical protein OEZ85_000443 [Tetradesmus obliquus]